MMPFASSAAAMNLLLPSSMGAAGGVRALNAMARQKAATQISAMVNSASAPAQPQSPNKSLGLTVHVAVTTS